MRIEQTAMAGTLESGDMMVTIEPADTLTIDLTSTVEAQYGQQIRATMSEVLAEAGITACHVIAKDRGALDCTVRARMKAAIYRAAGATGEAWHKA